MLLVGNAFRWKYTREIPAADGSKTKFGFDDWFFSREPNHMTAHASLTKLGLSSRLQRLVQALALIRSGRGRRRGFGERTTTSKQVFAEPPAKHDTRHS